MLDTAMNIANSNCFYCPVYDRSSRRDQNVAIERRAGEQAPVERVAFAGRGDASCSVSLM
jgi:pyruvate formate-lyase activating enzyme-like uncharacterized protein